MVGRHSSRFHMIRHMLHPTRTAIDLRAVKDMFVHTLSINPQSRLLEGSPDMYPNGFIQSGTTQVSSIRLVYILAGHVLGHVVSRR
jgi:hypothetical protein